MTGALVTRPTEILLVEDNPGDARLIAETLSDVKNFSFTLKHAGRFADGLQHIDSHRFDIVILDLTLPDSQGLDTVARAKKHAPNLPFIVLTGLDDDETGIEAVKMGAQDFLVKGQIDGNLLVRSIRYSIERVRVEEQERRHQARIAALHEIEKAISSTLDLRSVLHVLMEKIELALPYAAVTLRLWNEQTQLLEAIAGRNLDEQMWRLCGNNGEGVSDAVVQNQAPISIRNVQTDPRIQNSEIYRRDGLISYLGVPLVAKNEFLGALGFFTSEEREFAVEEVEFLSTLAGQAAIAIHNSQLYEKTLVQALELQQSIKVKDDFLGVVSHELRTPVNVIMGYANVLSERVLGELTGGQENALARIAICAEDLAFIIDDMLQVVSIDNTSAAAATIELELGHFIEELRASYSARFGRDLKLDWSVPTDLPVIYTDGKKLKHILKHLIGNAIKFTPNGEVVVSVRYLQGHSAIEFQIKDTGSGISDEVLPKIFDKFYQGDSTMNRSHGGCGLGLYIVKHLTELLGGNLAVTSEVGKGSVFTLALPIADYDRNEYHKQNGVSPILQE